MSAAGPLPRARKSLDTARTRVETRVHGTWIEDLIARLKKVDAFSTTTLFGAGLLMSVLPFIIILSSLADQRIDDDLSRHIGLDRNGAAVVHTLFRSRPSHAVDPIVIAIVLGIAGALASVQYLQVIYERIFDLPALGWRNAPRVVAWTVIFVVAVGAEIEANKDVRGAVGTVGETALAFVVLSVFFCWTMHFLLAGRLTWRALVRPAVISAALWLVLAAASRLTFSDTVVSDSKLYGTIGVVFTLLTWFILIGLVVVLGAAAGKVWEDRRGAAGRSARGRSRPDPT